MILLLLWHFGGSILQPSSDIQSIEEKLLAKQLENHYIGSVSLLLRGARYIYIYILR